MGVESRQGVVTATLLFDGTRAGRYRLDWAIQDKARGTSLAQASEALTLDAGSGSLAIETALDDLRRTYRDRVPHGAGGVLVEEAFRPTATLAPVLSESERAGLPPSMLQNLALGDSPLNHKATTDIRSPS